ncbi:hypothetical protein [Arthrobacter pityocampae]|uniref:hypothetical protein n=1 Tax=Arthrobacter pityocampae TaxID=547334 RepID=UPI0037358DB4
MDTKMKRIDLVGGLNAIAAAYRHWTEDLVIDDGSTYQLVRDVVDLLTDITSDSLSFADTLFPFVLSEPANVKKHHETVRHLVESIENQDAPNIEIWCITLMGTLDRYLRRLEQDARQAADSVRALEGHTYTDLLMAENDWRTATLLSARYEQMRLSHQLRVGVRKAKSSVEEAQRAAEDARIAAGIASGSKLTERFEALAKRHFWASTIFRILTTLGVLGGLVGLLLAPLDQFGSGPATDSGTAEAILRVSLLAAVLGLATYFGRQAAYHRDVSTWASTITEQLLTFDGYIDPVDDVQLRDQMRAAFAARVFGSSPESKEEPGLTLSSPVLSEVAAMFAKASSPRP